MPRAQGCAGAAHVQDLRVAFSHPWLPRHLCFLRIGLSQPSMASTTLVLPAHRMPWRPMMVENGECTGRSQPSIAFATLILPVFESVVKTQQLFF
jgi:hypothetical protein